jgi:hypothetical protein
VPSPRAERRRLSTVVRLFDPSLASNRFAVVAFLGVLGAAFALDVSGGDDSAAQAAGAALRAALAVFLAWAIARELHPDLPLAATVAAAAALPILLSGEPRLGAVVAMLFAVRVVAGTTGREPAALDLVGLPALAAYSARSPGGVVAGLALAGALALAALQEQPRRPWALASAVAAAVLVVAVAVQQGTIAPDPQAPTALQWGLLGMAAPAAASMLLRCPAPTSVGDLSGMLLSAARLRDARRLAVVAGIVTLGWLGGAGIPALVGLWAAVIGLGLTTAARR